MKLILLLNLAILAISKVNSERELHPAAGLSLVELVEYYGYPIEVHEDVQTEDGYLLTLHRIPHGLNNAEETNKPVVLLMHCLMCSAAIWATYGPENGLAFILADQGYDVWMPNARGTQFSKKHISLDPVEDAAQFWRFSWHQIGNRDLPASIDYIQEQTGVEKLSYVGYSQGTTSFYVLASTRPEYNDKFNIAISLAPIAYMGNLTHILFKYLSQYIEALEVLFDMLGWYEFVPNYELGATITEFCNGIGQAFCEDIFLMLFGQNATQIQDNWFSVFATHLPAGASSRQFSHYGQEIASGFFRNFDYGVVGNLAEYGTSTPPNYDLSKITAPMALFYSDKDDNAAVVDVEQLMSELPNLVYTKFIAGYGHVDFVFSPTVTADVNDDVVQVLSNANK